MKIKQAARYYLHDFRKSTIVFYIVIACIFLLSIILRYAIPGINPSVGGMESSTMIFLFVIGLNAFKSQFRLYTQCGISRRTLMGSFLLSAFILAVATTIIDSTFPLIFGNVLRYQTVFSSTYSPYAGTAFSLVGFIWLIATYFLVLNAGFFITTLYYRMNTFWKVVVSVGVPLLAFVILPMVTVFVPSFNLLWTILRFTSWVMGLSNGQALPWRAIGCMTAGSAIFACLSYLLIMRATVKDA